MNANSPSNVVAFPATIKLDHALRLAAQGFHVFPVAPRHKTPPLIQAFPTKATRDEAQIRAWWASDLTANIGISTTRFGDDGALVVVDVDNKRGKNGNATLFALELDGCELPPTRQQTTPTGGRHLIYTCAEPVRQGAGVLGPGLDIRSRGGYIVAAGSVVEAGEYTADKTPIADAPEWLLQHCGKAREKAAETPAPSNINADSAAARATHYLLHEALISVEGAGGDDVAFKVACQVKDRGVDEATCLDLMLQLWDHRCSPPWGEGLAAKIANAYRYGQEPVGAGAPEAQFKRLPVPVEPVDITPVPLSEDALALDFADSHERELRYVAKWGAWLRHDGQRWTNDDTLSVFDDARQLLRERALAVNENATARRKLVSAQSVTAVERLAKSDRRLAATVDQWDADLSLLNTPTGTVDLATGTLRPHRLDDYCTKLTATGPSADAHCPLWRTFLDRVTAGDVDLQIFLQKIAGYALSGSTREHALFFLYGTGANGKGCFLNTITGIYGDYARVSPIDTFTASAAERHPTDLAMLRGSRLVTAQETEEGRRWDESKIKALTGGDPITARFMRQDFFTYVPQFKLLIAGNHKPGLRNVDEAIRRRFHLVPFSVTIPAAERDVTLPERLRAEWPGILQWAIEGCLLWQREGLKPPAAVRQATEEYLGSEDALALWLEERCAVGKVHWASGAELFKSWREWAERSGELPGSRKQFAQRMEDRGFAPERQGTPQKRGFAGVGLRMPEFSSAQAAGGLFD